MDNLSNILGEAGEHACASELMVAVAGRGALFRSIPLSKVEPTADLLVFLLSPNGEKSGPFFFLQIKTTATGLQSDGSYSYSFEAKDVQRAQSMRVPFFLCVVDQSVLNERHMFIKGVDSKRRQGIYRLRPHYDLTIDAVKVALHDEVSRIWAERSVPRLVKLV